MNSTVNIKCVLVSIVLAAVLLISLPLYRISETGEKGLSFWRKITLGYKFPPQSRIDKDYKFKDGDVLVMYRPSCPDCQRYISRIMDIVGTDALYLCDRSEVGKALYDPDWVPSVIFFSGKHESVVEIRDDQDLVVLEEKVESFEESK